jgi:hypothetical protein
VTPAPALSYVIPCGSWRHVERVVGCLLEQDEADRIELVLAAPVELEQEIPDEVRERLWGVKVVAGDPHDMHGARAAGLLAAGAPLAVIGETHCYPRPGWARAFLAAFAEGTWDAIGPQIENANPATGLSWANLSLDYGPFLRPERGEAAALPGQNAGVRTALLEPYRDDLGERMRMPYLFFVTLRERGARLFIEPAARSAHLNVTDRRAWLAERFGAARIFATDRSADWPRWRRAVYTLGSPAIPLLRLRRALRDLRRGGGPARAVPPLLAGLLANGLGEATGYAIGCGDAVPRIYLVELDREAYAPR